MNGTKKGRKSIMVYHEFIDGLATIAIHGHISASVSPNEIKILVAPEEAKQLRDLLNECLGDDPGESEATS